MKAQTVGKMKTYKGISKTTGNEYEFIAGYMWKGRLLTAIRENKENWKLNDQQRRIMPIRIAEDTSEDSKMDYRLVVGDAPPSHTSFQDITIEELT